MIAAPGIVPGGFAQVRRGHSKDTVYGMSLLTLLVSLVAAGVIMWAINKYVPMDGKIKTLLNVVVIVLLVVIVLQAVGVFDVLKDVKVPRAHGH